MIIDTHCHLDSKRFEDDLDEVIKRAKDAGVSKFIIPGADPVTIERAIKIVEMYDEVYFAIGVHPCNVLQFSKKYMKKFIKHEKCVAIGECGLDYYRLKDIFKNYENSNELIESRKKLQRDIFKQHIELAKEFKKPLIIHIRNAENDAFQILTETKAEEIGGVLHCYGANEQLLKLAEKNFYFGIGGVLTFKNAKALPSILPKIPLKRLVAETDSPYLAPHPYRGKRNEPAYIVEVIKKMAEILKVFDFKGMTEITTRNSNRLFFNSEY